ncbi:MAG: VWA domain-containing protein, partial [Acidobacteria bacterium]|nr:VWA domain-containing protein [Acidobacteriota bacterium]
VRQEVRYFSRETDTPLTIGLLIDTSGSVRNVLEIEKDQAKLFLSRVLRPSDLAFVINFDLEVTLLQDFTNDMRDLSEAIDSVMINTGGTLPVSGPGSYPGRRRFPMQGPFPIPAPGRYPGPSTRPSPIPPTFPGRSPAGTLLYDAVYLSATEQITDEVGRKVLILLSDGQDQGSRTELASAISSVQRADTVIYALSISDRGRFGRGGGGSALGRLSRETGGRVVKVGKVKNMGAAFEEIAEELRSQYSLGYTPSSKKDGVGFRKIEVRVRDGKYKVQARRGYYPRRR